MANKPITFRPSKKSNALIADLNKLAKLENRTLNNYIETVLLEHTKDKLPKKNKKK